MRRLFQFAAFLMLAAWLPGTQHCMLEAAGVALSADCEHEETTCEHTCPGDVCEALEEVSPNQAAGGLRALPPPCTSLSLDFFTWIEPLVFVGERSPPAIMDSPVVEEIHRTWSFVRRSALPARAPDVLA